mmetsp:Transcript_2811/g.6397  ORF Transcript_2811/g.6397 Transcript_2811/m.6397 type:complete len:92 (+) Transcript_2811:60-335(+)
MLCHVWQTFGFGGLPPMEWFQIDVLGNGWCALCKCPAPAEHLAGKRHDMALWRFNVARSKGDGKWPGHPFPIVVPGHHGRDYNAANPSRRR